MSRLRAYAVLCGITGLLGCAAGLLLLAQFVMYHRPHAIPAIPTGPIGHYFVAFAGSALVAWSGCLIGAARRPRFGRTVGTATAVGLVLAAAYRMAAWVVGDYTGFGAATRIEAAVFLLLALGFVWLRPPLPAKEKAAARPQAAEAPAQVEKTPRAAGGGI